MIVDNSTNSSGMSQSEDRNGKPDILVNVLAGSVKTPTSLSV